MKIKFKNAFPNYFAKTMMVIILKAVNLQLV